MLFNVDNKGNITQGGEAFAFASSVMPKQKVTTKPQGATAQLIPEAFTFDTGAGIEVYPAGSYLVEMPAGTFNVLSAAQFQAEFSPAQ